MGGRQLRPCQCTIIVGMILTAATSAAQMPALGAIPTLENMDGNLNDID